MFLLITKVDHMSYNIKYIFTPDFFIFIKSFLEKMENNSNSKNHIDRVENEKDKIKAFQFYNEAAYKGDINAINNLGYCYKNGIGTEKNGIKAFQFYNEAAYKGDINGINNLGYCFQNGIGTKKNEIKAFQFYNEAAYKG